MIRTTLLSLIIAMLAGCIPAAAQNDEGRWTSLPNLGYTFEKVVEGNSDMYAISNGKLFSRSLDGDDETYIYSSANKLSDNDISNIFYNPAGKYLLIAYSNGNIDLLYDDGSVANLPDIKDAVISAGHGVNNAWFGNGRIYLATDFGMAIYDDKKLEVIDSGIYNIKASNVFTMGDYLVLISDRTVYYAPADMRHYSFDSFKELWKPWCYSIAPISDTRLVYNHSGGIHFLDIDFAGGKYTIGASRDIADGQIMLAEDRLTTQPDGSIVFYSTDKLYAMDADGIHTLAAIPEALRGSDIFPGRGAGSVWTADRDGVARYDLSGTEPEVLMQPFRPHALVLNEVAHFAWNPDATRLYMVRHTPSQYLPDTQVDDYEGISQVNAFDVSTGRIYDLSVHNFDPSPYTATMANRQQTAGWDGLVGGASNVCIDPDDPSIYYQAFNSEPYFVVKDGEVLTAFNTSNCYTGSSRGYSISLDPAGNLWLARGHADSPKPSFLVLPAAKRRNLEQVNSADFKSFVSPGFKPTRDVSLLFCRHSNMMFITAGARNTGMYAVDTKGTYDVFTDDKTVLHSNFADNDGHSLDDGRFPFAIEDKRGWVWFCSDQGPLVLKDPTEALELGFTFHRPVVPRNDGTPYGDYLLGGVKVLGIAVDPSDRKWMATESDGVYLVSADGTEIIKHFTTHNSPLPSNTVYTVTCNPATNKVYMGTSDGLYIYDSDSAPAAEDFSNVYAYPNPVRPDFTGYITIAGLKENSLVKIADVAGNVFYQTRSEGGMATWDGCNRSGERVRTGVYFVFVSEGDDTPGTSASGAVAKIMVVN